MGDACSSEIYVDRRRKGGLDLYRNSDAFRSRSSVWSQILKGGRQELPRTTMVEVPPENSTK
jgi:hypothetical protein